MPISESLADGLKNRFFDEIEKEYVSFRKNFKSKSTGIKVRDYYKYLWNATGKVGLVSFEGGTKRKPYFQFSHLIPLQMRQFKEWKEKSLFGEDFYLSFEPPEVGSSYSAFSISEHAVKRIFQRATSHNAAQVYNPGIVLNQLKYLPLWANFVMAALIKSNFHERNVTLSIQIPTPDGVLMGELDTQSWLLNIRTFVADMMLSEAQAEARRIVLEISEQLHQSPGSFNAGSKIFPARTSVTGHVFLSAFIQECENSMQILSFLTNWRDMDAVLLKKFVVTTVDIGASDESFVRMLKELGVRETLKLLEQGRRVINP